MATKVVFDGTTFDFDDDVITSVSFKVVSPKDVESKAAIQRISLIIKGNILDGADDKSVQFARWAASATRSSFQNKPFSVQCKLKNGIVRQYDMQSAFVVDYKETYENADGTGTFELVVNQAMSKFIKTPSEVKVTGAF